MPESLTRFAWVSMFLAIDWPSIRTFILGMMTGFTLLSVAIGMLMVSGENQRKTRNIRSKKEPLDIKTVNGMIEAKTRELNEIVRVSDNGYFRVAFDLAFDLIHDIAKYYFPESRYPLYELSPQEMLDLATYIVQRLDKILNGKIVNRFKNYRISLIVDILNKKKALDNSKLMKMQREYKLSKILSVGKTILNYSNPIFWFRKLALKPSTTLVTKEICKKIIRIAGEETDKFYSRKMFEKPIDQAAAEKEIDQKFDETLSEEDVEAPETALLPADPKTPKSELKPEKTESPAKKPDPKAPRPDSGKSK